MRRLQKFKKENRKKNIIKLVVAFMLVAIISATISYAVYQRSDELQFINAKVRFPDASEVSYTNSNNDSVTNVEQALNDLYERLGN